MTNTKTKNWKKLHFYVSICKVSFLFVSGVTAKETWEGLNRAFNSALSRRKKKKSGSGQSDDKPWKFETSMSFLKAVKEKRNTTSNLEQTEDCLDDENSNSEVLEQAISESGICNTGNGDENNLPPSMSVKSIVQKSNLKTTSSKRKASDDTHDAARDGLYKLMTQRMEDKHKSPRLKFFESIMPQVDEMTDDCFLNFQIEVLNCLKRSRPHDTDPKRLNDSCPITQGTWSTSTSTTPSPTPSTSDPMYATFVHPSVSSQQSYYQFP